MSSAETVVVAGAGNLAQYLVEEFIADGKYHVAVISRSSRPSLDALGVEVQIVKEYSREAVLPILDSFKTRVLISTLHTDDPTAYTSLHEALLFACPGIRNLASVSYQANFSEILETMLFHAGSIAPAAPSAQSCLARKT